MGYVRELDGLRGLMAIWVVLGHWASTIAVTAWPFGEALYNSKAVTVFIILSGFSIVAMVDRKADAYGLYLARRVLRIFPVYFLFLGLSVAIAPLALDTWLAAPEGAMKAARIRIASDSLAYWPAHLAAHLPALHGLIPNRILPSSEVAFLGQAWSISLEWQFYLVAPAMIALILGPWSGTKATLVFALVVLVAIFSTRMPDAFLGRSLQDFTIGILSYHLLKARLAGDARALSVPLIPAWLLVAAIAICISPVGGLPYAIWAMVLAAIVAVRESDGTRAHRLAMVLLSRPLQWIGSMAYSVYLSHMLMIVLGLNLLRTLRIADPVAQSAVLLVFTTVATLVVSTLSYRFVELPFHNLGRKLAPAPMPPSTAVRPTGR